MRHHSALNMRLQFTRHLCAEQLLLDLVCPILSIVSVACHVRNFSALDSSGTRGPHVERTHSSSCLEVAPKMSRRWLHKLFLCEGSLCSQTVQIY